MQVKGSLVQGEETRVWKLLTMHASYDLPLLLIDPDMLLDINLACICKEAGFEVHWVT